MNAAVLLSILKTGSAADFSAADLGSALLTAIVEKHGGNIAPAVLAGFDSAAAIIGQELRARDVVDNPRVATTDSRKPIAIVPPAKPFRRL
jgi:hypothetical protein